MTSMESAATEVQGKVDKVCNDMEKIQGDVRAQMDHVEPRIKELDLKEQHWATLEKRVQEHAGTASNKITLDIGT